MNSDLATLIIPQSQLERLTGLEIGRVFLGGVVRPSALRSPRQFLSFLVTEVSILTVLFIISLGVGLVILRSWPEWGNFGGVLLLAGGATAIGAIAYNSYQWQRYKTLRPLARLLDEVDRHNDIVQAVQVMDELGTIPGTGITLPNRAEVITALKATRDSLISALMTERIMRRHQSLMQRQHELFHTLETNLTTLQTLHVNNQAQEYQQFLQEALDIALAVQREMRQKP